MTAIELFAGVGGFRLGLERNKIGVVYANEWDKYASKIYDKNFGGGGVDRRSIADVPADDIPDHDLICGGFPCQAFSVAGKRRGFEETRGTLFFEIMRIARHHRTPYLFLENVKGLLSHDEGRTFETILRTLDELGYDCQWQVLNSKDFGVPQNRERVFIIGHLRDQPRPEVFPLEDHIGQVSEASRDAGGRKEAFIKTRHLSQNGRLVSDSITLQASETPHIVTLNPGVAAGGAVIPKIIDGKPSTTRRGFVKEGYTGAIDGDANQLVANTLTSSDGGMSERHTMVAVAPRGRDGINTPEYRDDDVANALRASTGGSSKPMISDSTRIRRLTPIECERLQGFPDNWTEGVSDNQRYKMMGNAVTVNVIEAIAARLPV